jgi:molybdate transport system substrate-binding protein
MTHPAPALAVLLALTCACAPAERTAPPAEAVRVISSNGVRAVLEDVLPSIEAAIGRPLSMEYSTANSLKAKIDGGAPFDVAILTPALIDALAVAGVVEGESRVTFARTGVGVGAREDASGDTSTPDALKQALLGARSVAFGAEGQSRTTIDRAFARLGITEQMQAKTRLTGAGEAPQLVARGEADLVLTLISEIRGVPGVRLLGPLPGDLQTYISFTAARATRAADAPAADALLRELAGPAVAAALAGHGMEPAR